MGLRRGQKRGIGTRRFPSRRKQERKKIAKDQIDSLLELALAEHSSAPDLAQRHAEILWNLSTRFNVRLKEKRLFFCRYCKQFVVPPRTARYRLSKRRVGINVTCLKCGRTYRKLFSKAK
ncbi:MAG: ribonuclease P protein component 4 [Nitrososphaerales archaeon]